MKRAMFASLGWVCVALGAVGILLPLLPTTPFMIVAAWAFAQSSPRFQAWLESHRVFGHYIRDWQSYRVIPLYAKLLAVAMMGTSLAWLVAFTDASVVVIITIGAIMLAVAAYLVSKPSVPPDVT